MGLDMTIGFIGAGVMAEVMISGLLEEGLVKREQVFASNRTKERADALAEKYGIESSTDNVEVASQADVVVLSVKPQTLPKVLRELNGFIKPSATVLSVVAGAKIAPLQKGLGHKKVVRCMPNLPCRIRKGMTVWAAAAEVDIATKATVQSLLEVMGEALLVSDEGHVDRATAVNGTGPAIVAEFVKAMLEAATYLGEPRSVAHDTVLATLVGTATMIREAGDRGVHVAQLIDEVTSPGGTTSRALQVLKREGFAACITESIEAAYERTVVLGADLEKSMEPK